MDKKYEKEYCTNCHYYFKHQINDNEHTYICMCEPYKGVEISKVDMCPKDMIFVSPDDLRKTFEEAREKTEAKSNVKKPVVAIVGGEGSVLKKTLREILESDDKDLLIDINDEPNIMNLINIISEADEEDDE